MTTQTAIVHIGVDVSKKHLDLSPFDKGPGRIPNNPAGFQQLARRINRLSGSPIVTCEASGGYERALLLALGKARIPASLVNPGHVRHFIRSQGIGAKNDRIDARMLARFAEIRHEAGKLFLVAVDDGDRRELRELLDRRVRLKEMILSESSRLDPAPSRAVVADIRQHLRQLAVHLAKIEKAIDNWCVEHPAFDSFRERLGAVKGFGRISVLTLIAFLPELGKVSHKRAGALVGVAPYERQSGETSLKASIHGGRHRLRRTLYMAAIAASWSNPILKAFYQSLLANGKPKQLALIAVLRKMVVLANRVAADPEFVPAK